ncbi:hypothetical protein ZWY2020_059957 [Hordeum vulgare]|nr:hypothetical protein ZWY2020_059957 [Hordeum vulgare]
MPKRCDENAASRADSLIMPHLLWEDPRVRDARRRTLQLSRAAAPPTKATSSPPTPPILPGTCAPATQVLCDRQLLLKDALRAADEFFSERISSGEYGDDDDEDEDSEPEDGGDAVAGFFLGLFERDAAVRGYYERSHEEGEFRCMGCVGKEEEGQRPGQEVPELHQRCAPRVAGGR